MKSTDSPFLAMPGDEFVFCHPGYNNNTHEVTVIRRVGKFAEVIFPSGEARFVKIEYLSAKPSAGG